MDGHICTANGRVGDYFDLAGSWGSRVWGGIEAVAMQHLIASVLGLR
jgi:hypothetical protein